VSSQKEEGPLQDILKAIMQDEEKAENQDQRENASRENLS